MRTAQFVNLSILLPLSNSAFFVSLRVRLRDKLYWYFDTRTVLRYNTKVLINQKRRFFFHLFTPSTRVSTTCETLRSFREFSTFQKLSRK